MEERKKTYGLNALPEQGAVGIGRLFLQQFLNPLIYILLFAATLSLVLGEWTDAVFILAVLLLNALIGSVQEYQAHKAAAALRSMVSKVARVKRGTKVRVVPVEELVPGDIVLLDSGDKIPADLRLVSSQNLEIDESLLTGESLANSKIADAELAQETTLADRTNMAFAGTVVIKGRGAGLIVATGTKTELGRIALQVTTKEETKPPLMIRMERFTKWIGITYTVAIVIIASILWFQGVHWVTILLLAVALAVAAIPEGLPVAITVALSVAMTRMARQHVIIRRMVATEALGSCTYIVTDKTGTLTVNELTVRRLFLPGQEKSWEVTGEGVIPDGEIRMPSDLGETSHQVLARLTRAAVLCNEGSLYKEGNQWHHTGDAIDVALLVFSQKTGVSQSFLHEHYPLIQQLPFETENQFSASVNKDGDKELITVKGAVERLLPMCGKMMTAQGVMPIDAEKLTNAANQMAAQGYRIIALAEVALKTTDGALSKENFRDLCFLGLVAMIDPPRPEARAAIQSCFEAGLNVAMVTGDHPATALAVAEEIGLTDQPEAVVTGDMLEQARQYSMDEYNKLVSRARVFARVEPKQKADIVRALSQCGHYVAVTGDGANDAPALTAAHVGVAMGKKGTDIAREASDLILADDNFSSIVKGIKEGRIAYANVRKVIFLLISTGAVEVVIFILSLIAGLPLPLTAIQLLWLNLVTKGIQHIGLAFDPEEGDEMKKPPRHPDEPIFNRLMIERIALSALAMGSVAFLVFWWLINIGLDVEVARNSTLLLLVLFENLQVFNARSETSSAFSMNPLRNKILFFGALGAQGIHILSMYTPGLRDILQVQPVSLNQWFVLLGFASIIIVTMELHKLLRRMQLKQSNH